MTVLLPPAPKLHGGGHITGPSCRPQRRHRSDAYPPINLLWSVPHPRPAVPRFPPEHPSRQITRNDVIHPTDWAGVCSLASRNRPLIHLGSGQNGINWAEVHIFWDTNADLLEVIPRSSLTHFRWLAAHYQRCGSWFLLIYCWAKSTFPASRNLPRKQLRSNQKLQ